jgi:hypothetical protein
MRRAYTHADFTIILGSELGKMKAGNSHAGTAMKIFGSRWMGRIWTLQGAYLSKMLVFRFHNDELADLNGLLARLSPTLV